MPSSTATASHAAVIVGLMSAKAAAIGIVVADLPASVAFYEHFGLSFSAPEHGHTEADLGDGLRLMLDSEESIQTFTSAWTRPFGSPRTTVCFAFETPHDVDAKFAELMEAGFHGLRGPWDAPWGQRYASVIDPDGSGVDLFARL
jgi:catechol 2,3-dioxygenase-like lactoylglutathione lyase family enzyme